MANRSSTKEQTTQWPIEVVQKDKQDNNYKTY